jgi:hypothetical protein
MDAIRSRIGGLRLVQLGLAAALLGLVGCVGDRNNEVDPLTGGPPIPRNQQQPNGQARAGNDTAKGPLPLEGGSANTNSAAALATGNQAPAPVQVPAQRIGAASDTAWHADPAVKLSGPGSDSGTNPAIRPASDAQPRLGGPLTPTANRIDTYQSAQDALTARGVTWQRLETLGDQGEWRFMCSIPDRKSPNVLNKYEAQAVGEHGVAAMRLAIQKIDDEQQP